MPRVSSIIYKALYIVKKKTNYVLGVGAPLEDRAHLLGHSSFYGSLAPC